MLALDGLSAEIVVVDNASHDNSLKGVEQLDSRVRVIRNDANYGYGTACNRGMAASVGPLLCFLNPDTIPDRQSIAALMAALHETPRAGAVGPKMLNSDGTLYPSCRVVPSLKVALGHAFLGLVWRNNPFTRSYQLADWDHEARREVDWISGAAMLIRRESFVQAGGFDEGYFMYAEDVDLCDKIRQAGWSILYDPAAKMIHHSAGSTKKTPYKMIRHHHFSLIRYAHKKARDPLRQAIFPFIALALLGRMVLAWIKKAVTGKP